MLRVMVRKCLLSKQLNVQYIMKKKYMTPESQAIHFYMENEMMANIGLHSGENAAKINNNSEILSNKKQSPIWGEQKTGMWDHMKD